MGRPHRFGCQPGQTSRRIQTNTVVDDKIRNRFKNAVLADKVTERVLAAAITRETLAQPEFIIGVSFQKEPITNLEYRVGEGLGRLLRKIMSRIDDAVFMQPDKHAGVLCGPPGLSGSVAPSIVTVGTFTVGF
jgi:hypothetical protein